MDGDPYGEYYKTIKLTDFNISTSRAGTQTKVGTPRMHSLLSICLTHSNMTLIRMAIEYMAPELMQRKEEIDTAKTDSMSLRYSFSCFSFLLLLCFVLFSPFSLSLFLFLFSFFLLLIIISAQFGRMGCSW